MIRVLVTDGMEAQAVNTLREKGFEVVERHCEPEELGQAMSEFDALVVRSATKVRASHLKEAEGSRLKLILRGGVGVDNIDVEAARAAGIAVRNTPRASSRSVAELALAHMLSCCRFISVAGCTMREDKWEKKAYSKGIEILGKTLGICGFGRIGQELGRMAKALGMEVVAYDPYPVAGLEEQLGIPYLPLEQVLTRADFLSVHAPGGAGKPMICREAISRMKDGVVIINTSRGSNVDEDALLDALESGKVRAAGLDVYQEEPSHNHALYSHPRVSCTPHIGAQTHEAQVRIGAEIVDILTDTFLKDAQ